MPALIPSFLIDLADPIFKTKKFLWKELPGDAFQEFGKSLDMKARVRELKPKKFELTLISRDGSTKTYGPFRSPTQARNKAEEEYSSWIRKNTILQAGAASP